MLYCIGSNSLPWHSGRNPGILDPTNSFRSHICRQFPLNVQIVCKLCGNACKYGKIVWENANMGKLSANMASVRNCKFQNPGVSAGLVWSSEMLYWIGSNGGQQPPPPFPPGYKRSSRFAGSSNVALYRFKWSTAAPLGPRVPDDRLGLPEGLS